MDEHLAEVFGDDRVAEAAAMARRAPLDLRVNTLKAKREKAAASLAHLGAKPTKWSPWGLRIALGADARNPGVHAEEDFLKGGVEVQDEGSQLAALFSAAKPGEQVIDLCAGAGGKTLALAAMMQNKGQIFATDDDKRRLAPIHDRLKRSGARNVQVRTPKSIGGEIDDLKGRMDLVLIDAPCTGSGTWRRRPDAKWRLTGRQLEVRLAAQAGILADAQSCVRPGGILVYITCSLFRAENHRQIAAFVADHPAFAPLDHARLFEEHFPGRSGIARIEEDAGLMLSPARSGTDGFFFAALRRTA
jgi:16S rRNA (cytosine967-C5)-methyltransferase